MYLNWTCAPLAGKRRTKNDVGAMRNACNSRSGSKRLNAAAAKVIITQYGGPDGELGASMRYLSQRYTMPGAAWRAC